MGTTATTYIDLATAAETLQTTEMRVLMMLRRGELTGKETGGSWLVDGAALAQCRRPQAAEVVGKGGCGGCSGGCGGKGEER